MNATLNVDDYIALFNSEVATILNNIRKLILKTAPEAIESINYGMPAYKTDGKPLIYFAAYKNHIGLYATPSGHAAFAKELAKYKQGKGSVQFPLNAPIPYDLIREIVNFRLVENRKKAKD